jgi:hypothetical protein
MKADSSLARYTNAPAIPLGSAARRSGRADTSLARAQLHA